MQGRSVVFLKLAMNETLTPLAGIKSCYKLMYIRYEAADSNVMNSIHSHSSVPFFALQMRPPPEAMPFILVDWHGWARGHKFDVFAASSRT